MRQLVLTLCVALTLVVSGCATLAPGDSPAETDTPVQTDPGPDSPTETVTQTPREDVSVEYVLHAGDVPDDLRSVTLTVQVVFVENARDIGPCWRDTIYGPYKPTPTPLPTPSGECHRSDPVEVTITDFEDHTTLGPVAAPGNFDAGHGLIVTDVQATVENGSTVTDIYGVGGHRANIVEGPPQGPYHVELGVERWSDSRPRFALVSEEVEPSG